MSNVQSLTKTENKLIASFLNFREIDIVVFSRFAVGLAVLTLQERGLGQVSTATIRKQMDDLNIPEWDCFESTGIRSRNGGHWCTPRDKPSYVIDALLRYSDRIGRHLKHHKCVPLNEREARHNMCIWDITTPVLKGELFDVKVIK